MEEIPLHQKANSNGKDRVLKWRVGTGKYHGTSKQLDTSYGTKKYGNSENHKIREIHLTFQTESWGIGSGENGTTELVTLREVCYKEDISVRTEKYSLTK